MITPSFDFARMGGDSPAFGPSRCAAPSLSSGQDRRPPLTITPVQSTPVQSDPFAQRFGKSLPRELRLEAGAMTWPAFEAAYGPTAGPVRLESWTEDRINSSTSKYTATLSIGHNRRNGTTAAAGPISAMTAILHDAGYRVEVTAFHQQRAGKKTATFIYCTNGVRSQWAMGIGEDCTGSILQAFIAATNLLRSA